MSSAAMMLPKKPEEETDTSTSFESFVKKRRKEIDTSYKFTVGGKLRDGSETQWTSKFDETLEYLMYPSLHSLPDDPIFADKQGSRPNSRQRTKPGSPKRGGRGRSDTFSSSSATPTRGGSPMSMSKYGARSPGSPSSLIPGSPGKKATIRTTSRDASDMLGHSDDERTEEDRAAQLAAEEELYQRSLRKVTMNWDVDVTAVDKLPETQEQKAHREFKKRVDEIGESFIREKLRNEYERERQIKLQALAEENREQQFRSLAGASKKHKDKMSDLTKKMDEVTPTDRFNNRRQGNIGIGKRRESSRDSSGSSMMDIMNRPEYIYKSLRAAGTKKKVMATFNMVEDDEDEEAIYKKQRYQVEKLLKGSDRGQEDSQFEMEGLLYYRFNYDHEQEESKRRAREEEDERVNTRGGKHGDVNYVAQKVQQGNKKDKYEGPESAMVEESQLKSEYQKLMVSQYKGKAQLRSDLNDVNLSRMRRAIYMRLNSLDQDGYLVDQAEMHRLRSDMDKETGDAAATSDSKKGVSTPIRTTGGHHQQHQKGEEFDSLHSSSPDSARKKSAKNSKYPAVNPNNPSGVSSPVSSAIHRKRIGAKAEHTHTKMSPHGHTSILRGKELSDDSPLYEIRDRALQSYMKNMGFERYQGSASHAFGIGTPSATATATATGAGTTTATSPTRTHSHAPSSPKAKFAEATISNGNSEEGRKMTGGLSNKELSMKALSSAGAQVYGSGDSDQEDHAAALSKLMSAGKSGASPVGGGHETRAAMRKMKNVSGDTRVAQDSLLISQLRSGVIPESYIKRSTTLEYLDIDIRSYGIGDEQGSCLGSAILGMESLRALIIEDNRLTSKSVPHIVRSLNTTTLSLLDLSCNSISNSGAYSVAEFLKKKSALTELRMNRCNLSDSDMPSICQAIRGNKDTSLAHIQLNNNHIGPEGAKVVAKLVSADGCIIHTMDISWNRIGTEGALPIAKALQINSSVIQLDLSACSIDDQGGQALAHSLIDNNSMEVLLLAQNQIKGGSCFVFSKTCATHPRMTRLDLSSNPVGEAGARSVYRQIMRGLRCFVQMRSCSYFVDDKIFNYTNPSMDSPYTLDVSEPYKSAVMVELLHLAIEHPGNCRFGAVTYQATSSGPVDSLNLIEKNGEIMCKGKKYEVPKTGVLHVEFFSSVSIPSMKNKLPDKSLYVTKMIVKAAAEQDRLPYLRLITADVQMTCAQAQDLIQYFMENQIIGSGGLRKMDILACTWTHLIDTKNMYDFMVLNILKRDRRALINEVTIDEFKFNWTNPTGHWRLNLENRSQLYVMLKLIAINKLESDYSRDESGRGDTSQEGNWFNFRNAKVVSHKSSKDITIDQDFVDHLPRTGIISFDYVSTTRPGAPHMVEQEFIESIKKTKKAKLNADGSRKMSVIGGLGVVADDEVEEDDDGSNASSLLSKRRASARTSDKENPLDKYQVISDEDFYTFLEDLGLSNRNRVSAENALFTLLELQLAVTKYWFTVTHVLTLIDCFQNEARTQANVTILMFTRIKDIGNLDKVLRALQKPVQRMILKRLGCLNVLNPLKLALDYRISMLHLDERILLTTLLEISPTEGTEAIREDPKTDISVLTFYGALHRIVAMVRDETLIFTYLETGVTTHVVAWALRRDAMKKFLVGTKPIDKSLFRVVGMHREMEKNGTLSRGPIELQYKTHLKIMKKSKRKQSKMIKQAQITSAMRRESTAGATIIEGGILPEDNRGSSDAAAMMMNSTKAGGAAAAAVAVDTTQEGEAVTGQLESTPTAAGGGLAAVAAITAAASSTGAAVLAAGGLGTIDDDHSDHSDGDHDHDEHVQESDLAHLDDHDDEELFEIKEGDYEDGHENDSDNKEEGEAKGSSSEEDEDLLM